ncbi:hypothetical protein [Photobacterium kasasachensis]|uniref:hypothetical protein n=1 Tax=Photobacterium kasasachensis TaxID=2910240 RepID=UPI003D0DEE17
MFHVSVLPLYEDRKLFAASVFLLVLILLGACSSTSKTFVDSPLFGEHVFTTVDSEVARYYLGSYLQGEFSNRELDERISGLYRQYRNTIPSRDELKSISQEYSVDFASLFLADLLLKNECNNKLNKSFMHHLDNPTIASVNSSSYTLLFVPGWDYAESGHLTGADFKAPRAMATKLGVENYLVELPPTGSVEQNAEYLAKDIIHHGRAGKGIILAGASSAGPAIHLALAELLSEKERGAVKAWLNIGGILQGSPLIDYYQKWPHRWFFNLAVWDKGWDKDAILSMGTSLSRSRFSRLRIESDLLIINYLGIPLSGQLSKFSIEKYPLLKPEGPNDGLTLLTDAIAANSMTIVALGSDHYFAEDPEIDEKTIALMALIMTYLDKGITRC